MLKANHRTMVGSSSSASGREIVGGWTPAETVLVSRYYWQWKQKQTCLLVFAAKPFDIKYFIDLLAIFVWDYYVDTNFVVPIESRIACY